MNLDQPGVHTESPPLFRAHAEGRGTEALPEGPAGEVRNRLALAIQCRDSARRPEAEALCREALRIAPEDVEALRLAGALAFEGGRQVEALEFVDRAIVHQPGLAGLHQDRGTILRALGRLDDALAAHREAIGLAPTDAEAWYGAGSALQDLHRMPEALRAYQEALRLRPAFAEALLQVGVVLTELGRPAEGLAALEAAARLRPDLSAVQDRLGCALGVAGRWEEAVEAHRRAIALRSDSVAAYCNLGTALSALGRYHAAADALQAALTIEPHSPDAHNCMGMALRSLGYLDQAVSAYRQALAGRPDFAEAHFNLGVLLAELDRPVEALSSYRSSLAFRPEFAEAHARMGGVLMKLGRSSEAVTAYRLALTLHPASPETWYELGNAMREERRMGEAIAAYSHAIELEQDHAGARYARGQAQLSLGDFAAGWAGYEWRWKVPELRLPVDRIDAARWKGELLEGRTILISASAAAVDEVFRFARYLPLVAARGGRVIFESPAPLRRLLEAMPCIGQTVTIGDPLPAVDFHLPLGSLPGLLTSECSAPPSEMPYLPTRTWSTRVPLLPAGEGLRVGVVWRSREGGNARASLGLPALAPLFRTPGISWYSLETGDDAAQLGPALAAAGVHDLAPLVRDVADLAALIGQLDLVVTVDAAVADLVGGLGIPVWVLLRAAPAWQWGVEGDWSSWYPTARLFRQNHAGGWAGVVEQVGQVLRSLQGR